MLGRYVKDESVDLVYLDPPFNSQQDYNVLFADHGTKAAAQIKAFEDTWQWDETAARAYQGVVEAGGSVSLVMQAFRTFIGESDMLAYLAMMAPRLVELRRILKPTGTIYLHCDPTASHYLKMLMDAVIGPQNFMNEVVWKRTSAHNDPKRFGRIHDVLLVYGKSPARKFNVLRVPLDPGYVAKVYSRVDEKGRRYRLDNISAPGGRGPVYEWGGITQAWRYTKENMEKLYREGRIRMYPDGRAMINAYVRYLDESEGQAVQDWWDDIGVIAAPAKERLGYPTQKPQALLERIIQASSSEGDLVLDPFCGCGTTVAAAQALKRKWIGIDITHLAIGLIKHRLRDTYGPSIEKTYRVIGEPVDDAGARQLASEDKYQFQWWALGLIRARPVEEKKGADKGIDGRLFFHDESASGKTKQIIASVKGGHLKATDVRDLRGVIEREGAAIGVLISLEEPTAAMRKEAASAGFYKSPWGQHPRIQLRTVAELLAGKDIDAPRSNVTFKKAPKARQGQQTALPLGGEDTADDED